jgi:hypothetical protein
MRATCPAHLILLDLITLTILVKNTGHEVHHYAIFSTVRLPPIWMDTEQEMNGLSEVYETY